MKFRSLARWCALTGLVAALGVTVPATAAPKKLPTCKTGTASTRAPASAPSTRAPKACQATPPRVELGRMSRAAGARTTAGYHHLGAGTAGVWRGVYGRMQVVNGAVRPGTYDFLASRFLVKRDLGGGKLAWLEAGWAETGWSGKGRQRIYTFNTNTNTWQFYDQYKLKSGSRIWIDVHTDGNNVWQAWLWWNDTWNLLTTQKLPIGSSAYVEQYVEVHVDDDKPTSLRVPRAEVDNVKLRDPDDGGIRYWRSDVDTVTGGSTRRSDDFCLDWVTQFDTWSAGDCERPAD
ncbi:hypothetical protein [Winogradskya humida]|uniref:hypothetical protein n=1 Tax=Winogradskya humida TaxID=113566 RepID=UPI001EF34914|nr:hypothetical protein [Actinoplanes humidus]